MQGRGFLPATKEEWDRDYGGQPDFVYVIGDAYVDHPSFGPAIISRVLESHGYTVAMLPQPMIANLTLFILFLLFRPLRRASLPR